MSAQLAADVATVEKIVRVVVPLRGGDRLDEAWRAMRAQALGALPVVDAAAHVVGVVTEDDLLVRGAPRKPIRWWTMLVRESDELANDYRRAVGTVVEDVMSPASASVGLETTVAEAARVLRDHRLRMLPVIADGTLAGVVTAADLIEELIPPPGASVPRASDAELVAEMRRRIEDEPWASRFSTHVTAHDAVVALDGLVNSAAERAALVTMARTIPGCAGVEEHLVPCAELLRKVPALAGRI